MSATFELLSSLLDEELARQENLLGVCLAQQRALASGDSEGVERASKSLDALQRECAEVAPRRVAVVNELCERYGIDDDGYRLLRLIEHAAEPLKSRLSAARRDLRETIGVSRDLLRSQIRQIRAGSAAVSSSLASVGADNHSNGTYEHPQGSTSRHRHDVRFVDQRG